MMGLTDCGGGGGACKEHICRMDSLQCIDAYGRVCYSACAGMLVEQVHRPAFISLADGSVR
jgi:hypothetical protein